jgi:hypothetical protein
MREAVRLTKNERIELVKLIEHDKRLPKDDFDPAKIKFWSPADPYNPDRLRLECIIEHPIFSATRAQLKKLGQELYDLVGSTDAMRNACDEIADMDKRHFGLRGTILDKAWDGVEKDKDRWWA